MIKEIIEKYRLAPDSYYDKNNITPESDREMSQELTLYLQRKWEKFIPKGWYGFMGLGHPTPLSWFYALDEFFTYLLSKHKDLRILQVKVKFGQIRIYLENISKESEQELAELESVMKDQYLVY